MPRRVASGSTPPAKASAPKRVPVTSKFVRLDPSSSAGAGVIEAFISATLPVMLMSSPLGKVTEANFTFVTSLTQRLRMSSGGLTPLGAPGAIVSTGHAPYDLCAILMKLSHDEESWDAQYDTGVIGPIRRVMVRSCDVEYTIGTPAIIIMSQGS